MIQGEEKERYVANVFEGIAPVYDKMNLVLTLGLWRRWQQAFLRIAQPQPSEHWLDLACGTADLSILLSKAMGPTGKVTGLDLSPKMLLVGRQKVAQSGLSDRIVLQEGNAMSLPFPDGTFDGLSIGFALRNVADLPTVLREMHRVVRPGGRVVTIDVSKPPSPIIRQLFYFYFYRIVPELGRLGGKGRAPYAWLPTSLTDFPDAKGLAQMMCDANFTSVKVYPLSFGSVAIHHATVPHTSSLNS